MKTASSDTVIETMVKPICLRAFERRFERRLSVLDVARDVLGDHDGVVDDEARSRWSAPSATGCRGCSPAGT